MPPKKETWKEELERKLEERLDKWEERVCIKLGKGQSPVVRGFGVTGKENGVILIIASTYNGGGTRRGRAAETKVYWHIAGASLHHIPGCQYCVSTADHLLADAIKRYRGKRDYWQMEVWAMPAAQFHVLHEDVKWSLDNLCEAGAVKVHGYFSLAEDKKLRPGGIRVRSGLDMAIVELLGPMTGLSADANQPRVVTREEAGNVRAYVTEKGAPKVEITLEGRGHYICGDGQDTDTQKENKSQQKSKRQQKKETKSQQKQGNKSQQKESKSQEKKEDTSVMWTKLETVSWTNTTISGMAPRDFGVGLQLATWNLPLRYAGELRILEAYIPRGLGGGGAYTILPARALNPNALATDPDVPVLLGTCAAWEMFYDDEFPSTVIYGQRSCRAMSAMCFLFSSWLTDLESWLTDLESWFTRLEGELKDGGDEDQDEDTQFWLIKIFISIIFLTSIILLDRRHDDVLSLEDGGDLEEEGIYKMLSTMCFFFSSLFADFFFSLFGDFKKGIFTGGGEEDQDTRFGLIKFVISIILLDRRNDDVLLIEGQGGGDAEEEGILGQRSCRLLVVIYFFFSSVLTTFKEAVCKDVGDEYGGQGGSGGNLAEEGTHLTSLAFLTQEGLAEQMAGTYYRI